jgi:hypothetical protein
MNAQDSMIYEEDSGQYKGAWITSGSGVIITRDPKLSAAEFSGMVSVQNAIQFKSTSPRLNRDGKLGARFNFNVQPGFVIKFANEHQVKLITELTADKCKRLALQLRKGWSFSVEANQVDNYDLSTRLAHTPIIVVLSHCHIDKKQIEAWHSHPSYRVYAESDWIIKRNDRGSSISCQAA